MFALQSISIFPIADHPQFLMDSFHLSSTVLQNQIMTVGFLLSNYDFCFVFLILSKLQSISNLSIFIPPYFLLCSCNLSSAALQNYHIKVPKNLHTFPVSKLLVLLQRKTQRNKQTFDVIVSFFSENLGGYKSEFVGSKVTNISPILVVFLVGH